MVERNPLPDMIDPGEALMGIGVLENILLPQRQNLARTYMASLQVDGQTSKNDLYRMYRHLLFGTVAMFVQMADLDQVDLEEVIDRARQLLLERVAESGNQAPDARP